MQGSHLANKKTKYGVQQREQGITEGTSGLGYRTVSGAPPDSVRCTRGLQLQLATFGHFQRHSAIIHRTVRCSKEERPPELASLRKTQRLLRYNSPDMSGVHRTVRCNSGATATSRQRLPAAHLMRARSAQKSGTRALAHRTLYSTCPMCHRTSRRAQKTELQRSESNDLGDVAGAPDMSGVHRTVRCDPGATATRRQRLPAAHLMRALRAQKAGAPIPAHRTMNRSCPVCTGHPGGPTSQKLQRSESNALMTWRGHRTCPVCTGLSGAPSNRQPPNGHIWWLGL